MDYFGINSPHDLPKLKEIYDEALIQPTQLPEPSKADLADEASKSLPGDDDQSSVLSVGENGELIGDTQDDSLTNPPPDESPDSEGPDPDKNNSGDEIQ